VAVAAGAIGTPQLSTPIHVWHTAISAVYILYFVRPTGYSRLVPPAVGAGQLSCWDSAAKGLTDSTRPRCAVARWAHHYLFILGTGVSTIDPS
jgi:uncharacterized membrane protein